MCDATNANTINSTTTTAAVELLGPNPKRKSFLLTPIAAGANGIISLSLRPDVVAGAGTLNYIQGAVFPTLIDDSMLGDAIGQPWWVISANGGEAIQVTEFLYAD